MTSPLESARKHAESSLYTMTNPYTTTEEKIEIEAWYQLPVELAGHAFLFTTVAWAFGILGGWAAYGIAVLVGIISAIVIWLAYSRSIIPVFLIIRLPYVGWLIHLGISIWLAASGHWLPAIFLFLNRLLFFLPVGFPVAFVNQVLTFKYKIHPKYAFLKRFYGKEYPFE